MTTSKPRLLWLALLLTACGPSEEAPPHTAGDFGVDVPDGTPVVLISIDTLRADRLPAYGYPDVDTPALDALRRDAVLFERAYSHIPLTLPAHSSLLTGLLPPAHGVRDNVGYPLDAAAVPFLPRALRERGYATGGAVSSFVLRRKTGLDADFDFYEDSIEFRPGVGLGGMQRRGGVTLELARDWLREASRGPFFFFFHIYEPHTPYTAPEPFASRYASPYDAEVASADAIVGDLLDELRGLGVYDDALVVLLSDHGEGLGEHGEDEHGVLLYTTTLHVPLLVKLPHGQLAGESVAAPVQLIDVFPTVAGLLGLPVTDELPGTPLLAARGAATSERRLYAETFYPRLHFGWSELASLVDGQYHYIGGPDPELYDLAADPGETTNVLRERRGVYAAMRDELAGYERALVAPQAVDEETRRALAALGYVGSGPQDTSGPLPDPKSRLHTLTDLMAGFRHHSKKQHAEAVDAFRRALEENPRMVDGWEFLGQSLQALGETEEALAAYQKALEISGGAPHLAVSAASLFFDLGRDEEASNHARLALDSHPSFAHGLLARLALKRDELEEAEREARLALDDTNPRVGPSVTLAEVLYARKRYDEALAMVEAAEATFAAREARDVDLIRGLYLQKGKVLADLGRPQPAEAAFLKEIELFPEDVSAYSNLAILYALTGRPREVPRVLQQMVEASPTAAAYAEGVKTLRILKSPGAEAFLQYALRLHPDAAELRELRDAG